MLTPEQTRRIVDVLERRYGVDALWLFGSGARGGLTAESDLDIAALFRSAPTPDELLDTRAILAELAGRPVDLVDLDHASPVVVMQVLRTGRLLVDANPGRRHRLEAGAPSRYEDLRIVRRPIERAILERVRRGRS